MKSKDKKYLFSLILRYFLILALSFNGLFVFYFLFSKPTIYISFWILKFFFDVSLDGNIISLGCPSVELISACIAGSAYFLLLSLNLSTPEIKIQKRIISLLFIFFSFFFFNIVRIVILSSLYFNNSSLFDVTHDIFWIFLSTILVAFIWFANIFVFKINSIPGISDLKWLYKKSHFKL